MRAPVLSIGLLVAVTGACKDEPNTTAAAGDGAGAEAGANAAGDAAKAEGGEDGAKADGGAEGGAEDGAEGGASGDQTEGGDATHGKGGLAGLTLDLVDQARRSNRDLARYVPDSAEYLVRLRFAELFAYEPFTEIWRKVEARNEGFRTGVSALLECMVSLERFEDVVIGFDSEEHLVLAVHAEGLGKDETWRCLESVARSRSKDWDMVLTGTARGDGPQLVSDDGDHGYFPDDSTLVMTSKAWDAEVVALLAGTGTPAVEGQLAAPAGRIAPETPLWLAGRIGSSAATEMTGTPFVGMVDISLAVRIADDDLAFAATFDAGEVADATRMKDELTRGLKEMEGFFPILGFPATFASSLTFETEGDLVSLDFSLTKSDVGNIYDAIGTSF